jgi:AraC family transcriptional regulator
LARLCGLSRRQLVRAFRAETGQTIGGYIQASVIARAKRLLQDTNAPVSEIAAEVGFTNPAAFSTAFRRACGSSPRDYRMATNRSGK